MTPKEKRERLFRNSRPYFREFKLLDGEDYHKDIKVLWVAHKHKPFYNVPQMKEGDFVKYMETMLKGPNELVIVEDENPQYSEQGPVGIGTIISNGWKIEVHVEFFPWATTRNKLRSFVGFMQWARNSRKIGCVMAYSLDDSKALFDKTCEYGVLHYVGRIKNGDPRGDQYLYSVKGRKT